MQTKQRYLFVGILLLLLLALGWGGLSLAKITGTQEVATHTALKNTSNTSKPAIKTGTSHNSKHGSSVPKRVPSATPTVSIAHTTQARAIAHPTWTPTVPDSTFSDASSNASLARSAQNSDSSALNSMAGARLIIPAIGINAPITAVGVKADGSLQTPQSQPWTTAGWYENGPQPGESGNAIIDGHLDRPGGYAAVFWNLRYLHPGDKVIVQDKNGHRVSFHVTGLRTYGRTASAGDVFRSTADGSFLNLITCSGIWMPALHETTSRLVVFTAMD